MMMRTNTQPTGGTGREGSNGVRAGARPPHRSPVTTHGATSCVNRKMLSRLNATCFITNLNQGQKGKAQMAPRTPLLLLPKQDFIWVCVVGVTWAHSLPKPPGGRALRGSCLAHCALPSSTSSPCLGGCGALGARTPLAATLLTGVKIRTARDTVQGCPRTHCSENNTTHRIQL